MIEVTASAEAGSAQQAAGTGSNRGPRVTFRRRSCSIFAASFARTCPRRSEPSLSSSWPMQSTRHAASQRSLRQRLRAAGISEAVPPGLGWLVWKAELTCDPEAHADLHRSGPDRSSRPTCRFGVGSVHSPADDRRACRPDGRGKTTTLAKLAAHFRLSERQQRDADHDRHLPDGRGGAAADLRRRLWICRWRWSLRHREMAAASSGLAERESILIDTAGRSPHDDCALLSCGRSSPPHSRTSRR